MSKVPTDVVSSLPNGTSETSEGHGGQEEEGEGEGVITEEGEGIGGEEEGGDGERGGGEEDTGILAHHSGEKLQVLVQPTGMQKTLNQMKNTLKVEVGTVSFFEDNCLG